MKILESAENYLETILILQQRNGNVRAVEIAAELDFSKPSVSVAMKNLRENGYVLMDPDGYLTLTDAGREIAEKIYERHQFFTEQFIAAGVDPEIAERDACRIEHAISQDTFEKIRDAHKQEK